MIKKIISVLSAISMLAAMAVAPAFAAADTDTVVYEYDYADISTTSDGTAIRKYGAITATDTSKITYGGYKNDQTVGNLKNVWWICALRPNSTSGVDSKLVDMVSVNFDGQANGSALNSVSDGIVSLSLDFGVSLQYAKDGQMYLKFNGKSDSSKSATDKSLAVLRFTTTANTGNTTAQFVNKTVANGTVPSGLSSVGNYVNLNSSTSSSNDVYDRLKLEIIFNMYTQKYSAYMTKLAEAGASSSISSPERITMVENQSFIDSGVALPSTMVISAYKGYSGTSFSPVCMNMSILSDTSAVNTILDGIKLPETSTSNKITLPTYVSWTSGSPDVITNDGWVYYPSDSDKQVTLTAEVTSGEKTGSKDFVITVPKHTPFFPENGMWVNDEMNYSSVDNIPLYNDGENPFGFTFSNADRISTNGNGITITKTTSGENVDLYKYIAPSVKQPLRGSQVIEFDMTLINNPKLYITLSDTTWKGPNTINCIDNELSFGSGGTDFKFNGNNVKITLLMHHTERKLSAYANGELWSKDVAYRTDGSYAGGYPDVLKLLISLKSDSVVNSGVTLNNVRVAETPDDYASFCLTHENTTIPTELAAEAASVSLPSVGKYNNTISWSTSDPSVISADGTVSHFASDKTVTLTPTYTNVVTGASKEGTPFDVTVKARAAAETAGTTEMITPETGENESQRAVGYLGTATPKNEGFAPVVGFKLSYPGKTDKIVTFGDIPNVESNIRFGVIITYTDEDNFDINSLSVTSFIKD